MIKRAINVLLAYSFKNMIYSGEDNLKIIFFLQFSCTPRYRSIGRCKGHWRKSCVTRREDLTTLVYIAAARKREGGLRSNFFLLSPVSRYALRNTRRHFFRLTPPYLSQQRAITYAKRPKSNDRLDLSAGSIGRNNINSAF